MKNYKLFWENLPETGEEVRDAVNHLLSLAGPEGEGATEVIIPMLIDGAAFGFSMESLLNDMKATVVASTLSKEMH